MSESGVILIDKPEGITSFDVIRQLRRITGIRKMGHTGTLDPFASGLLIICFGKATRLSTRIISESKEYLTTMLLGKKTETGDLTGKTISNKSFDNISEGDLDKLIPSILNIKEQTPPRYSALKINGRKAYELARKNQEFKLDPRPVNISDFKFEKLELPEIIYKTTVSKGTYIRVLSESIGELLNTDATTSELRRLKIGDLSVSEAVELNKLNKDNWQKYTFPMIKLFTDLPRHEISETEIYNYRNGMMLPVDSEDKEDVVVVCKENVLGFGSIKDNFLRPRTVMV